MRFTQITFTLALAQAILAAPIQRQLAGEGSACNSVFTDTDSGVGYGIEYGEENLSGLLSGAKGRRQLHGEGIACDDILSQTDNGVGYGVENAEDGVAANVAGLTGNSYTSGGAGTGGSGSGAPPPPAPPPPGPGKPKRQLDKVANGFGAIGQAAGLESITSGPVTQLDNLDGESTSGAADLGASLGSTELNTLETLGKSVPGKRQADKIGKGAAVLGQTLGTEKVTTPVADSIVSIDGTLTDGASNLGAGIADPEASTLEGLGSAAVPVIF